MKQILSHYIPFVNNPFIALTSDPSKHFKIKIPFKQSIAYAFSWPAFLWQRWEPKDHENEIGTDDGQYMDINGLASYIKRSKGAIRNLVLRRIIPYRKPAGRLIFLKGEIDEWVQMAFGKSLDEIKNDI